MSHSDELAFSRSMVALFKNVVFKEADPDDWDVITNQKNKIEDYVSKIGLTLVVDEMDGYGYLKQRSYGEGEEEILAWCPGTR
jgi:PP-loop superfamily ATP-utilizing enzyme